MVGKRAEDGSRYELHRRIHGHQSARDCRASILRLHVKRKQRQHDAVAEQVNEDGEEEDEEGGGQGNQ